MKKLKILTKHNKWWKGQKGITWAYQKGEDWFLIRDKKNEINEPKFKNEKRPETKINSPFTAQFFWNCLAASIIGIVIGVGFWTAIMLLL